MSAQGPPSYSELETNDRARLRREAALAQVSRDATYCVHYSSLREILNSKDLADRIARYPEGDLTPIEYFHQVPADTPQDPWNLWLRKQDPTTGAGTVTSPAEDPWDLDVIPTLPDGASPVNPGPGSLAIYTAMVIGARSQERDLSDEQALERCKPDVRTAITYALGRIEATGASLDRSARMYSRCRSVRLGRRPGNRPSARAFACPATERSLIEFRHHSLKASTIVSWSLPVAVAVLKSSDRDRNSTPARCRPSITCSPWVSPLESRSMWVTTRVSPSTTRSNSSKRPPRSFLAPLASSAWILPREQPARTSRSTCRSRFLSSGSLTETLA